MKLHSVQEGKITLWTPKVKRKTRSASRSDAAVFFNPEMQLTRDISVSVLQTFAKQNKLKINGCDALSATGVRGLRYAKEVTGVRSMVLNDKNPVAVNLIKKNIKKNKLSKKCKESWKDANLLLREKVYNFIDIDPFGTPNIFMDSAGRSIWHKGMLAVTATDTAPLSGTYPMACLKKYGITSMKTPFYSELGLRILITYIILTLARYERAFVPVLSHATLHYFRIFGKIEHSGRIEKLLKDFGYVFYCPSCGRHEYGKFRSTCKCGEKFKFIGPIYLGKIQDRSFVKAVRKDLAKRKFPLARQELKLLDTLASEVDIPFYFDLHKLAKKGRFKIKKMSKVIADLKKKGYSASRTHFCPTAIKTDKKL